MFFRRLLCGSVTIDSRTRTRSSNCTRSVCDSSAEIRESNSLFRLRYRARIHWDIRLEAIERNTIMTIPAHIYLESMLHYYPSFQSMVNDVIKTSKNNLQIIELCLVLNVCENKLEYAQFNTSFRLTVKRNR